jgi:hypothetical protein
MADFLELVLGKSLTDKELNIVFKEYDSDNSGEIDLGEFTHMIMVFLKMTCKAGCTLCTYPEHFNQPQTIGAGEGGGGEFQAQWAGRQLLHTYEEPGEEKVLGTHFTEYWGKLNDNEKAVLLGTATSALKTSQHQPEGVSERYQEQRRPGSIRESLTNVSKRHPFSQDNVVVTQRTLDQQEPGVVVRTDGGVKDSSVASGRFDVCVCVCLCLCVCVFMCVCVCIIHIYIYRY